ncbi:MAG: hypothetical protein WCT10_05320 [Patescibacteria group bacterium]|jgi:hypothetical protein
MPFNRKRLKEFLTKHGVRQVDIVDVMANLALLCQWAKTGEFMISAGSDHEAAAAAIRMATGLPVEKVAFLSVSQPLDKPDWMSEIALTDCVNKSFGPSLASHLGFRYICGLNEALGEKLSAGLGDCLQESFGSILSNPGQNFWAKLRHDQWFSFLKSLTGTTIDGRLRNNYWYCLFCYLGLLLVGRKTEATELVPLIRLMATNPVLGQKAAEHGTWIVLTA